jgi:hypothetical protein
MSAQVASRHPHEDEEKHHRRHQASTVGGAQEAEDRETHCDHQHAQHLHLNSIKIVLINYFINMSYCGDQNNKNKK